MRRDDTQPAGYVRKTTDRVAFTEEALRLYRNVIEDAGRVLVKPNVVSHEAYPTTTHPDVLRAVLRFLEGKDFKVADAAAVDLSRTHHTLRRHELNHVCEKFGTEIIDLHQTPHSTYRSPQMNLGVDLSRTPFNFDLILSLPVLKSHPVCSMSGALKNQFGFTTKAERIKMHSGIKDIHKAIAEINLLRPPGLIIMDVVDTLIGANEIRHGGKKVRLGYMLAGTDPVALDARGLELLVRVDEGLWGKKPADVKHLAFAARFGVGKPDGKIEEI